MMIRAAQVTDLMQTVKVGEIAGPTRGPGQALVEVLAASINPVDQLIASGKFYLGHPELPYVPGSEGVGRVLEGDALSPGALVRFEYGGLTKYGSLAERTVVPENAVIPLPESAPSEIAACLGVAGWAAWLSLEWRARLAKGERVLVLGATGAVGKIAVQAARLLGSGKIVAAGRNAAALEEARGLGADAIVELDARGPAELAKAFTDAAGGPINVVVDLLWGVPALAAVLAAGSGARLVNIGQSAGDTVALPAAPLRGKMVSVLGYTNLGVPKAERQTAFLHMLDLAMRGDLKVSHETFSLERAAEAWRAQLLSPHHKLVITPKH